VLGDLSTTFCGPTLSAVDLKAMRQSMMPPVLEHEIDLEAPGKNDARGSESETDGEALLTPATSASGPAAASDADAVVGQERPQSAENPSFRQHRRASTVPFVDISKNDAGALSHDEPQNADGFLFWFKQGGKSPAPKTAIGRPLHDIQAAMRRSSGWQGRGSMRLCTSS
jgi:hypothetical protein